MKNLLIQVSGHSPSLNFAGEYLAARGVPITDSPSPGVTHLLLDAPSFDAGGTLRGGGDLMPLLDPLPKDITVCGGRLIHPALRSYKTIDLLEDAGYLAENAYITAEAALEIALRRLPCLLRGCEALILGWGRIGKCLAGLLQNMGAAVTVAARKESDRTALRTLGCNAIDIPQIPPLLPRYRLIFNTVPHLLLPEAQTRLCRDDCVKIDLASQSGMAGPGIITARGLPGLHKPESSGSLIAETLLRLIRKEDTT